MVDTNRNNTDAAGEENQDGVDVGPYQFQRVAPCSVETTPCYCTSVLKKMPAGDVDGSIVGVRPKKTDSVEAVAWATTEVPRPAPRLPRPLPIRPLLRLHPPAPVPGSLLHHSKKPIT